jgi:hypothetical protein
MNTETNITGVKGRVFGRDNFGVCVVQLDGHPGVIRVKAFQQGLAHHLKRGGCSILTPVPVVVDVGSYDITQMVFLGAVYVESVSVPSTQETTASESSTQETTAPESFTQASRVDGPPQVKKSRRLMPMVF